MPGELSLLLKFEADVKDLEKKMNEIANKFGKNLDKGIKNNMSNIVSQFQTFMDSMNKTKEVFAKGSGGVGGFAQALGGMVQGLGGAAGGAAGGSAAGGAAAGAGTVALLGVIAGVLAGILIVVKKMVRMGAEASGYFKAFTKLFSTAVKLFFKPLADAVGMILVPIMVFILRKFIIPMLRIWKFIHDMIKKHGFIGAIKEILGMAYDLVWQKIIKGIPKLFEKAKEWVMKMIDVSALGKAVKRVIEWAKTTINKIKGAFQTLRDWFGKIKEKIAEVIGGIKEGLIRTIGKLKEKILLFVSKVKGFFGGIKDKVVEVVNTLTQKASEIKNKIVSEVTEFASKFKEKIVGFVGSIKEKIANLNLSDRITEAWQSIKGKVSEFVNKTKEKLTNFIAKIKEKISQFDFSGYVTNIATKIKDAIVGTFKSIWSAIKGFFKGIWNKISSKLSDFNIPDIDLNIPGFQTGGYVKETGLALLHKGEVVIPAWQVPELRNMGSSGVQIGSINVTVNVDRVANDVDIDRMARQLADKIMREIEIRGGI